MIARLNGIESVLTRMAAAALLLVVALGAQAQTVRYIHTDALGSVALVTDQNRNVVERREYEPYGATLTGVKDGPGYAGHVQDAATGLTYMQQRYYDPVVGQFLSVDPVTANGSTGANFNRYWYANNNPYKFTDPDGRMGQLVVPIVIGGGLCARSSACRTAVKAAIATAAAYIGSRLLSQPEVPAQEGETGGNGANSNPYHGPVDEPVVVVDGDGNAIPVEQGEQVTSSPDGKYQQVRDKEGNATGTRMDKGGHKGQADPKAQGPHAHRPGVTDDTGNPHLPINEPKPKPEVN